MYHRWRPKMSTPSAPHVSKFMAQFSPEVRAILQAGADRVQRESFREGLERRVHAARREAERMSADRRKNVRP